MNEREFYDLERKVEKMADTVARLDDDIYNHDGQPGLKTQFLVWMTEQKAVREYREKADEKMRLALQAQNDKQNRRWNAVLAIVAILTLLLGVLVYFEGKYAAKQGKVLLPHISDFQSTDPVVSSKQEQLANEPWASLAED